MLKCMYSINKKFTNFKQIKTDSRTESYSSSNLILLVFFSITPKKFYFSNALV